MNDSLEALAVFAAIALVLEIVFFVLRRKVPSFHLRLLYQLWVVNLAALGALKVLGPASLGSFGAKLATTSALMLSTLVGFAIVDSLVLQRPWNTERDAMMPKLGRDVLRLTLVITVGFFAATKILGQPVGAVLVSSTVLSAVVGLSLQDTLKNIFAGMSLDLEKPFRRGDWLMLDGGTQVQVIDMSWRSTRLLTKEGVEIFEPNASLSVSRVFNYGSGTRPVAILIEVGLPYGLPPAVAKKAILDAAESSPKTLRHPPVKTFLASFDDHSIGYQARVWTRNVSDINGFRDEINSRIWYRLKRLGIEIPFPIRTVHMHDAPAMQDEARQKAQAHAIELFSQTNVFEGLDDDVIRLLAETAERRLFDEKEIIVKEGDAGDSLVLIQKGSVRVVKSDPDSVQGGVDLAILGEGAFFGEMSLLTGEPRSATVIAKEHCAVLILTKEALAPILGGDPRIAQTLSRVLAARQHDTQATLQDAPSTDASLKGDRDESSFLRQIRTFFFLD